MTPSHLTAIAQALLTGAYVTVQVSVGALVVAVGIGLLLASVRFLYPGRLVHAAISIYVEIFRNIPSLTHLFIIYFGLAYLGLRLTSLTAAIVGLGLIGGAVLTDVFRSGLQAISPGQREAALSVGMSPWLTFRLVVLPQAWRIALPPLGNYAIGLVKDTSLVAAIAAPEIMFNARQIVNETFETSLVYSCAAVIYVAITFGLGRLVGLLERRAVH